jgi:hypothetical protein
MESALPPAAVISAAIFWPASPRRPTIATLAPSWANRRAVASPIPDVAPLIQATWPANLPWFIAGLSQGIEV